MDNADALSILRQLEQGKINAQQADARLTQIPASTNADPVERDYVPLFEETNVRQWIRRLWIYPLIAGVAVVMLGAAIIVSSAPVSILWLVCGLPILLFGTLLLSLAGGAQSGHWLYINVKGRGRQRHHIQFGIPFPIGLLRVALWLARLFGRAPGARLEFAGRKFDLNGSWQEIDAVLSTLEQELKERRGITVDVNERDGFVQVYII